MSARAFACSRSQLIALSSFKSAFEWKTYAKYWRFIAATKQQHECQLVVDFISFFVVVSVSVVAVDVDVVQFHFSLSLTRSHVFSLSICNYLHCYKKKHEKLRFHFLATQRNTDKIGFSVHFQFIRTTVEQAHTHLLVLSFIGYNCARVYVYSWDFFVTFFIYFSVRSFRFTKFLFYICWSYTFVQVYVQHHIECRQCDPFLYPK